MNKQQLENALADKEAIIQSYKDADKTFVLEIDQLRESIEKLEETINIKDETIERMDIESRGFQKHIDEMHSCFDEIEGVMPRFKEPEESWMSKVEMSLPSRFASYCRTLIK